MNHKQLEKLFINQTLIDEEYYPSIKNNPLIHFGNALAEELGEMTEELFILQEKQFLSITDVKKFEEECSDFLIYCLMTIDKLNIRDEVLYIYSNPIYANLPENPEQVILRILSQLGRLNGIFKKLYRNNYYDQIRLKEMNLENQYINNFYKIIVLVNQFDLIYRGQSFDLYRSTLEKQEINKQRILRGLKNGIQE